MQIRVPDLQPRGYPVCERHADGCMDYVRGAVGGPIETVVTPIRDDD